MTQTNVDSVLFTEVLILSWFILCLRVFSSVEKIGRCREIDTFYFQSCMFSTQAFMESKKKRYLGGWGAWVCPFSCFRNSRNR